MCGRQAWLPPMQRRCARTSFFWVTALLFILAIDATRILDRWLY